MTLSLTDDTLILPYLLDNDNDNDNNSVMLYIESGMSTGKNEGSTNP
jgi:hypothetical protein